MKLYFTCKREREREREGGRESACLHWYGRDVLTGCWCLPAGATPRTKDTHGAEKARAKHLEVNSPETSPPRKVKWTHYCIQWGRRGLYRAEKSIHNLLTEGFSVCVRTCGISLFLDVCIMMLFYWTASRVDSLTTRFSHNTHRVQLQRGELRIWIVQPSWRNW